MPIRFLKHFIPLFLGFIAVTGVSHAQQAKIRVVDDKTSQAIGYGNVCFESVDGLSKTYLVTDDNGKVDNLVKSKTIVAISYVGYHTLYDTIMPGESKTFRLAPAILNMEEVVVTGQYMPERTDKSIYKVQVISAKEIQSQAAVNLEEILSTQLNIKISHDAALGSKMKLQGIGGENVKVLVDGVPVIGRMNGDIDLSQISLSNIERIEMVEGPMSVNYGTNALAGVINLITRDHVNNLVDARLNTYYESVGQYNFDGSVGIYKEKNTFIVNGGRNFFAGFSVEDTSRSQQWKPKEQLFGEFKYKRRIGKTNLRLSTRYFDEYVLDKGTPQLDADTANNYYFYKARDGHYYTKRWDNSLSWTGLLGSKYLDVMASYSWYEREREVYIKNLATLSEELSQSPTDFDTTSFDSWVVRGTISRFLMDTVVFNYQAGFDINLESGKGKKIEGGKASIGDYALFASLKYRPTHALTIQPGLRMAYNTGYDAPLTPSINVMYDLSESWLVRASYGKGFRAPSLKELYLDFVDLNHKIYGSDSLKAEYSNSYHLSFSYKTETTKVAFKIEPDFFYNQMKDKIDLVPKTIVENNNDTTEIWTYSNVDLFKTLGGRLNVTYNHKGVFNLGVGLAYIGTNNQYSEAVEMSDAYNYYPEVAINAIYEMKQAGLNFGLNYKYTGEVTMNRLSADNTLEEYTEESYNMLDISVNRSFFKDFINLAIGAKNLFDVKDIKTSGGDGGGVHSSGGSSMPVAWGRTFFASVKFKFSK
jgi:outer membrane receptor for ferrienterochelin and colicins